ncbi:hypothetical protein EDC01DRAFT_669631 [Geopyxis carbonaria]|nr:hypothetical protein EDC01DRAFT_669631 [Geopyxis carbonaria]
MAGRFVRSSKYRHIFGRSTKKELCYDNLHISKNAWDSNIIKANPSYLSVNWEAGGGGAFAVIPLGERGRQPEIIPLFRGHTAAVLDTDWSPFNDSIIASGSDDGKVFIWQVPENFTLQYDHDVGPTDVAPVQKLAGHTRKVGHVLFHPVADNVLATSSGDYSIKLWDVNTGNSNHQLKHGDIVQSMSWSTNGSMLVTTCRDKKLRVWDPRQQKAAHEVPGHTGAKNSRAVWMTGDVGGEKFATTGFSKMSDRQLGLWDMRTLTEGPVGDFQMLDSISGVCMPFWDEGTKCLYLAGKGDGNIRYYEYSNDDFIFLSEYKSADPQRGIAFLPRRGISVVENEVMRAFKTVNDSYIEPISFIVPRRAETFQSDIFPPAQAGQSVLTSEEWFGGKDADPPYFDMESMYTHDGEEASPITIVPKPYSDTPAATPTPTPTTSAPVPKPAERAPSPVKEKAAPTRAPVSETAKAFSQPAAAPRPRSPVKTSAPAPAPAPVSAAASQTTPAAAPMTVEDNIAMMQQLSKITALLESQNVTLRSQNEHISRLTAEVDTLKDRVAAGNEDTVLVKGVEELEDEGKRKDERIRKLELELEEARS